MFDLLIKNLTVSFKQIEKIQNVNERKSKAIELNIPKNINRMKTIDEPAFVEFVNKYKSLTC